MPRRPESSPAEPGAPGNSLPWPPPYTVRSSKRARYARLRVRPDLGLQIIIPAGIPSAHVPAILERHKDWVCKTLLRVCGREAFTSLPQAAPPVLPKEVRLHGGSVLLPLIVTGPSPLPGYPCWRGENLVNNGMPVRPTPSNPVHLPALPLPKGEKALPFLRSYLHGYARHTLGNSLFELGRNVGLMPSSVTVRRQKSRWGSCTVRGKLNVNLCLIFLPQALCRHVLLHELCHLRQMNHGQEFWKLLFSLEPDALRFDKSLRSAWKYVPPWIWSD